MELYYTDEINVQILISLLKSHGIKKVVASPGTGNLSLVGSMQHDSYFEMYSAADERSAAYIACGMAAESGEPVVLSCTGATASRNYFPGLTEAFYRKLPLVAVTSSKSNFQIGHNMDQVTDRTLLPNDIAKISVQMPYVTDCETEWGCTIAANKALLELHRNGNGPVHINLETRYSRNFNIKELPKIRSINRIGYEDEFPQINGKKIAVVVGAHVRWSDRLTKVVDKFCAAYNGVVLCDPISNYKGDYGVYGYFAAQQENYHTAFNEIDLVIHIGDITSSNFKFKADSVWRVNPDGEIRDTFRSLKYVFEMTELHFFENYVNRIGEIKPTTFYEECKEEYFKLIEKFKDAQDGIPFSNIWIATFSVCKLPSNSILHLGIRNSLRSWSFIELPNNTYAYSNTGGFGIDGCLSSAIGAALVNENKLCFTVLGDLAFFYDMNSLGNRYLPNNIRILLINNGTGMEMKIYSSPVSSLGIEGDAFLSAKGHYGRKSDTLVKHYTEDLGFEYLSAHNKHEFEILSKTFFSEVKKDRPMILEAFIDENDDNEALRIIRNLENDKTTDAKKFVKSIIGEQRVDRIKKILKR